MKAFLTSNKTILTIIAIVIMSIFVSQVPNSLNFLGEDLKKQVLFAAWGVINTVIVVALGYVNKLISMVKELQSSKEDK